MDSSSSPRGDLAPPDAGVARPPDGDAASRAGLPPSGVRSLYDLKQKYHHLLGLARAVEKADGDYYTDAPECARSVRELQRAIHALASALGASPEVPLPDPATATGGYQLRRDEIELEFGDSGTAVRVLRDDDGCFLEACFIHDDERVRMLDEAEVEPYLNRVIELEQRDDWTSD